MKRLKSVILRAAGVAVLVYASSSIRYMHLLETVGVQAPGACVPWAGLRGAEDMVTLRDGSVIASLDDRDEIQGTNAPNGQLVRIEGPDARRSTLWTGDGRSSFHPHGIDDLRMGDTDDLFVINHAADGDRVMVFRWTGDKLALLKEIPYAGHTLNDISAVSEQQFYVTVDHATDSPLAAKVADYLRLPIGHVAYFDGSAFRRASGSLAFANGIALSADKRRVYVSEMLDASVVVYQRGQDESLTLIGRIPLPGSPDNITVTADDGLLVAVHPKILALAAQRRDRQALAPSEIVRIARPDMPGASAEVIFSDPGTSMSSASVALMRGKDLLIGSVYGNQVESCACTPALSSRAGAR